MKKEYLFGGVGFLAGIIIMGIIMFLSAPGIMMLEDEAKYGFDETYEKLMKSVKDHKWKAPKIHDLQKTMKKYGHDVRPVKVIELCHPDHAAKILKESGERIVSSLMPCRVAIYEKSDGKVYVSRMNSGLMASTFGGIIADVMDTAAKENEVILEAILK